MSSPAEEAQLQVVLRAASFDSSASGIRHATPSAARCGPPAHGPERRTYRCSRMAPTTPLVLPPAFYGLQVPASGAPLKTAFLVVKASETAKANAVLENRRPMGRPGKPADRFAAT